MFVAPSAQNYFNNNKEKKNKTKKNKKPETTRRPDTRPIPVAGGWAGVEM